MAAPVLSVAPDERIYAIGDIHGRDDLLLALFDKIGQDIEACADERAPKVVFLGDYIDRGDRSREVIDLLMKIKAELGEGAVFLRGNHEAALLNFIMDPVGRAEWLRFGGLQTLGSYKIKPPKSPLEPADLEVVGATMRKALGPQLAFLEATELWSRSGDVLFCHAGIDPETALEYQSEDALLWGQSDFIETGGVANLRVVHGHYDNTEVVTTPYRICVDTGAYYSGRLTAVRLDAEETFISADVMDVP